MDGVGPLYPMRLSTLSHEKMAPWRSEKRFTKRLHRTFGISGVRHTGDQHGARGHGIHIHVFGEELRRLGFEGQPTPSHQPSTFF